MLLKAIATALLLIAPVVQNGRVTARLSSSSAGVGETVTLDVIVEDATDDVDIGAPHLPPGLNLVGTQDYTEMSYSFPGTRHMTRRREFAIQTTAPGRYRIPPVEVTIGRRVYRTSPVDLTVTGSGTPRALESNEDAWLNATMSPETVYVGQQSTLTVQAGFSEDLRVRLTRPPEFDTPSPTGFWVQDVPDGIVSRLQAVKGRVVETQTLQRAYFPLSAGKFAFAPARAIIEVREGFLFAPETHEIRSGSPKIVVLPLPDRGKPHDFKGAIGSYTIKASLQSDTVAVGEAAQVTIELAGAGNIKAMPTPVLPTLAAVEEFSPTEDASITFDGPIVRGTKTFQWVLIPQSPGKVEIPAISYSYFDPKVKAYKTIATSPLTLFVTPAASGQDSSGVTAALRGIMTSPRPASLQWVRSRGFLLLQLVPLLLLLAAVLRKRLRKERTSASLLREELARIRTASTDYKTFLHDLEAVLRKAAKGRTGPAADRAAALIARIQAQRFAPAADIGVERDALLQEADDVVSILTSAGTTQMPAALLLLALLQAQPAGSFATGVEQYRTGRFREAAATFEQLVKAEPHDAAAWSNLGNAWFRAGERGRAVWAWAHAAREAPRNGDVVGNLQAVGAVEVLRTRPPLSVRPVEWYFLAALLWWLACGLAFFAYTKRRAELWPWCVAALVAMIAACTTGAVAQHARYAVALDDETKLYGDPTIHSPVVRTVVAGTGLDVLEVRGDWLRVRTLTEAEGWVENDAAGLL